VIQEAKNGFVCVDGWVGVRSCKVGEHYKQAGKWAGENKESNMCDEGHDTYTKDATVGKTQRTNGAPQPRRVASESQESLHQSHNNTAQMSHPSRGMRVKIGRGT
jgi:hypothetical protein